MNRLFNPVFINGKIAYLREVPKLRKPIRSYWGVAGHPATIRHSEALKKYNSHISELKTYTVSEDFERIIRTIYPDIQESTILTEGIDFTTINVEKPFKTEEAIALQKKLSDNELPAGPTVDSNPEAKQLTDAEIEKLAEKFWHQHRLHHYGKADYNEVKTYYIAGYKEALKNIKSIV